MADLLAVNKLFVNPPDVTKATAVASVLTVRLPPVMCMFPAEFNFATTAVVVIEILGNATLPTTDKLPVTVKLVRLPTVVMLGCAAVPMVPTMLAPVLPMVPALTVAAVNNNVVVCVWNMPVVASNPVIEPEVACKLLVLVVPNTVKLPRLPTVVIPVCTAFTTLPWKTPTYPPAVILPATPTPPSTTMAPVLVETEGVVVANIVLPANKLPVPLKIG